MAETRILVSLSLIFLLSQAGACSNSEGNRQESVFKRIPEVVAITPERPVKIKLKRNAGGKYSWDVSGDDTERVIEADRRLRESLNKKPVNVK